jgi:type III secretion protein L
MGLAFLIRREGFELSSDRTLFKRDEFTTLLDAQALIRSAEQEAAKLRDAAQHEVDAAFARADDACASERERGYHEGKELAQQELAEKLATIGADAAKTLVSLESVLVATVIKGIKSILREVDADTFFNEALQQVAASIRDEEFVTLRVCPAQEDAAERAVRALLEQCRSSNFIQVTADPELAEGACVLESPSGTVDASLETQLAAIGKSLRASFQLGPSTAPHEAAS